MGEPMTKQRLSQYIYLKMEVEHQLERIARMRSEEKFPAMRESDGSQHVMGTGDRMERAIIRRMEYEDKVADQLEASMAEMEAIERAVDSLPNIQEREVLRLRYIDGSGCRHMSWPEVAMAIYRDNDEKHKQAVYRIHGRALKSIGKYEEGVIPTHLREGVWLIDYDEIYDCETREEYFIENGYCCSVCHKHVELPEATCPKCKAKMIKTEALEP